MSVAFRRESDEEHKEPKFELPIPPGPNLVTSHGLALIQERVTVLEAAPPASDEAERERAARDLRYWRQRLATARVTEPPEDGTIGFGSHVRIRLNGQERELRIVGDDEAVPTEGSIGLLAPLARAIIGAEEGERIAFGGRDEAIEIVAILG